MHNLIIIFDLKERKIPKYPEWANNYKSTKKIHKTPQKTEKSAHMQKDFLRLHI